MIRWIRNLANLFRKPKGADSRRTESTDSHSRGQDEREAGVEDKDQSVRRKKNNEQSSSSCTTRSTSTFESSASISTITTKSDQTKATSSTTTSSKSTASTIPSNNSRSSHSRSSSGSDSGSSMGSSVSKDPLTTASTNRNRGRSPTRRDNVNAERRPNAPRQNDDLLSPTNRTNQLDRRLSAQHENTYYERKEKPNGVWNEEFPPDTLVMYTDGSYLCRQRCSGIGIFVAPGHELNRSQRIRDGTQNSEHAEFVAVKTALQNALDIETYRNQKVIIRTDCLNVIDAIAGKRYTEYSKLKSDVIEISKQFPKGVDFQHVYAHADDPGNELADKFAGIATGRSQSSCGGFRNHNANRERNRMRSKSNDTAMIRQRSHSIPGRR